MTIRAATLFTPEGLATYVLRGQWAQQGGLEPIQPGIRLIDAEGRATTYLRRVWDAAFPTREPLPRDAIATPDGRGEARFWDLLVP